jgi:glutathione S-transferase
MSDAHGATDPPCVEWGAQEALERNQAMNGTIDRGELLFYHSPNTRSTGAHILLEELGAKYEPRPLNMKAHEQRKPAYLGVNPMGKVPAILHNGTLVTEQGAIFTYLADLFPEAKLAPTLTDTDRGAYLRWMFYYGNCVEPAVVDKFMKHNPAPLGTSPYGTYDLVVETLAAQVRKGPFLLGERFSAVDVLWGSALGWLTAFKLIPELPEIMAYLGRYTDRPSVTRVNAYNAKLGAEHEAAAKA